MSRVNPLPGHFNLRRLATLGTADPGNLDMDVGIELKEAQVSPLAFFGVMYGLCQGTTCWAGKARTPGKGHIKINPILLLIKVDIDDFPRGLQTECSSEQGGLIHVVSPEVGSRPVDHVEISAG